MRSVLRPRGITSRPLVSCIMPTFNRPRFVARAIEFFLAQTWHRAELLIFDDSPAGLQTPPHPNARVKVVRLRERTPMWAKHNLGLDAAQGEILAHFDDDDWQSPLRLVQQVETIVLGGADICGVSFDCLLTCGDARFWRFAPLPKALRGKLVGNAQIRNRLPFLDATAMFRRDVVGAERYPALEVGQKVGFLQALWDRGARLTKVENRGLYVYVRHDRNTWQPGKERRLIEVPRPIYFPAQDLPFYRRAS